MNRIFMSREDAIRLVLEAYDAASGNRSATLFRSVGEISGRVDALGRLLLDIRAGRLDEFQFETDKSQRIFIKN
ncbi:hypothetical protein [Paraburkholderia acidisoli]|uniref:Uncharacterized protein n=1 Tax=Paraburkholderia acidisoli TaxID=2571748 RepID=A0A7Z2GPC8_9BURK|nr:hypothetical protein [Paraburkholderia acidisoli]QGZ65492.1 hypothetical protein FAZ98_27490 [Paraburkholderia acidisoli]